MTNEEQREILRQVDRERQTLTFPGETRHADEGVIRDLSADGKSCTIIFSSCSEDRLDQAIENQLQLARQGQYELEWKLYGHDRPERLADRLAAAGFTVGDREAFLVLPLDNSSLDRFGEVSSAVQRITDAEKLNDIRLIYEETLGMSFHSMFERHRFILENHPSNLSIYVAYVDGEPASCGRVYFHEQSRFAGLYGGTTREKFRKRGLFTQIVAARLREALGRGIAYACVDALPTSEPILRKRGFEVVTFTQPFTFTPVG